MTRRDDSPIFLIGYRGTGKSTVACELGARLQYQWVDADDIVEERAGKTIARIFADEGEAAFRAIEAQVLEHLVKQDRTVAALGGGVVLREDNRQLIRGAGAVVWLTAAIETIWDRLNRDEKTAHRRPNLTLAGGEAEIEELLAMRTPLYRECATLTMDTEGKTAADVADEIMARL
jgi:shikimate kinase